MADEEVEKSDEVLTPDRAMEKTMHETMKGIQEREKASDVQTTGEGDQPTEKKPVAEGSEKRARDITGKFKPKDAKAPGEKSLEGQGVEESLSQQPQAQAQAVVTQAPSSWSPEARAKWDTLPPEVRAQALKREQDISRVVQQSADRVKRVEGLEKIIEPHKGLLSKAYASPEAGITDLLNTFRAAHDNPLGFVAWFCQSRGIDPRQLSGVSSSASAPQDPNLAALLNRVQGLEGQLTQRQQAEEQQFTSQAQKLFEEFVADPKNSYVQEVQAKMAELLEKGMAEGLQDAYDQAIYMRPDLREKIFQERIETQKKADQELREKQAKDARKGAIVASVTRPNAGATPSTPKSWEDTLKDKHKEIQGRAA